VVLEAVQVAQVAQVVAVQVLTGVLERQELQTQVVAVVEDRLAVTAAQAYILFLCQQQIIQVQRQVRQQLRLADQIPFYNLLRLAVTQLKDNNGAFCTHYERHG
jgi:hypothetical protein